MIALDRRRFLNSACLAAAGLASGCASPSAHREQRSSVAPDPGDTALDVLAQEKGLRFGSAISASQLSDPKYTGIIRAECGVLVAENEHKWYAILPEPDAWNFAPADAIVEFAGQEGLAVRGHTLVWHHPRWLPRWVNELNFATAAEAEALLGGYVDRVARRYEPVLYSWDVVNETIDDKTGELRETCFSRAMGPEVIDFCFFKAREAAPAAKLAYNDYMSWESGNEKHRAGVLKLLERLKSKNVPIDALGIQSHSNFDMPNEFTPAKQKEWRRFVEEASAMGLEIYLTEFDVNDTRLGPDIATRDRLIASYTKDYLDLMLSYPAVKEIIVWGMADHYSWLQTFLPRTDGVEKRPTIYDSSYRPKPVRDAVAAALAGAPTRTPGPSLTPVGR